MMAPLSLLYGLPAAVVAVAVIDGAASPFMLTRRVWAVADRERAFVAVVAAAATLPIGAYILRTADPTLLRQIAGAGVLAFVAALLAGFRWRGGGRPAAAGAGAAGGLIGGATSLIGPPVILYFLARGEAAERTRASLAIYISGVVLTQAAVLAVYEAWAGVAGLDAWTRAILLAPVYAAGILVGRRLFDLASPVFYRRLALALVTVAGALALLG